MCKIKISQLGSLKWRQIHSAYKVRKTAFYWYTKHFWSGNHWKETCNPTMSYLWSLSGVEPYCSRGMGKYQPLDWILSPRVSLWWAAATKCTRASVVMGDFSSHWLQVTVPGQWELWEAVSQSVLLLVTPIGWKWQSTNLLLITKNINGQCCHLILLSSFFWEGNLYLL